MKLRSYQQECLDSVWSKMVSGGTTSLVVLPCAAGKTVIFNELINKSLGVKSDLKACVLFNRVELLGQQTERMANYLKKDIVGQWCGSLNKHDDKQILMSSIQSIYDEDHYFDLIIVDETHNLDDKDGKYFEFIKRKLELNPKTKLVGFTATPYRYDGYIYGKDRLFKEITYSKSVEWFVDNNYLVPLISKEPDHVFNTKSLKIVAGEYSQSSIDQMIKSNLDFVRAQIKDAIERLSERKKIVWQCSNIEHSEFVSNVLNGLGEKSVFVHSKMTAIERAEAIESFENGDARHMTFITIVSEGYDYPPIDSIVLMRPTKSASLYVQTVGRGMRIFEDKENCLVLDYANVVRGLGPISDPVIERKSKGKKDEEEVMKVCKNCRAHNLRNASECEVCNSPFPKQDINVDKMNLKADESAEILGKKKETMMEIGSIKRFDFTSKNGNECHVIEYSPKGFNFTFGRGGIREYFVKENPWAMLRYEKRLAEVSNNPTHVAYEMDGKYPRVKKLLFDL